MIKPMRSRNHSFFLFVVCCAIILSSCFKQYKGRIQIDGSSTVYPITEAVAEEFRNEHPDIWITKDSYAFNLAVIIC